MHVLSVDFQKEFFYEGGKAYKNRPCHAFIKDELIPFFREEKVSITEIISDYRLPRPRESQNFCVPGTAGFESGIPNDVKKNSVWIKSMNSPAWTRDNAGIANKKAGVPYCDPEGFGGWLLESFGSPEQSGDIVLIGLTLDCCVLCTAQELYYRGYNVLYLWEGCDTYLAQPGDKENVFRVSKRSMWGELIYWNQLCERL